MLKPLALAGIFLATTMNLPNAYADTPDDLLVCVHAINDWDGKIGGMAVIVAACSAASNGVANSYGAGFVEGGGRCDANAAGTYGDKPGFMGWSEASASFGPGELSATAAVSVDSIVPDHNYSDSKGGLNYPAGATAFVSQSNIDYYQMSSGDSGWTRAAASTSNAIYSNGSASGTYYSNACP